MQMFCQSWEKPTPVPDGVEWILPLRMNEWLAADAVNALEQIIARAPSDCDVVALPVFLFIGNEVLRGAAFDATHEIRIFRNRPGHREAAHLFESPAKAPQLRCHLVSAGSGPRIHRRVAETLRDFAKARVSQALSATQLRPPSVAFAEAWAAIGSSAEDDLSRAASLVEAWATFMEYVLAAHAAGEKVDVALALPIATVDRES